uniref:Uncharacterized protein n=1 Tax=Oryza nivara TaxID=4536 RepID=A0A0E0J253_ORYNI
MPVDEKAILEKKIAAAKVKMEKLERTTREMEIKLVIWDLMSGRHKNLDDLSLDFVDDLQKAIKKRIQEVWERIQEMRSKECSKVHLRGSMHTTSVEPGDHGIEMSDGPRVSAFQVAAMGQPYKELGKGYLVDSQRGMKSMEMHSSRWNLTRERGLIYGGWVRPDDGLETRNGVGE